MVKNQVGEERDWEGGGGGVEGGRVGSEGRGGEGDGRGVGGGGEGRVFVRQIA